MLALQRARPLLLQTTSRALRRRCLSQRVEVLQRPAESGSSYTKFGDDKDDTWRVEKVEKRFNPVEPFLPAGFPTTVTPGYGTYAALQFAAYACSSPGSPSGDASRPARAAPAAFAALDDRGGFLLCPDGDRVRVLLYEDAAPADVLGAAFAAAAARDAHGGGRPGGAAAFVAAIAGAGWRVDTLPVAFDKGRLLRAPPAVADPGAAE
ncbi:hypothetical protein SO694_000422110 [Aureococcus anophagefferens]|uniref:Uncharacterized protein n=1 Tax=Aureococcus anophagefferens TaxID=44056 RepID=A0ABR1G6Y3_AURAN